MINSIYILTILLVLTFSINAFGQGDGFITMDGDRLFPIGSYYLPKDDGKLKEMADAGFNILRCSTKADLDRVQSVGLLGWLRLSLHQGATNNFKKKVDALVDHPSLALWEGPDEVVWWFTGNYDLYFKQGIHEIPHAWYELTEGAIKYAKEQSSTILPNINQAISYIRSVDPLNRQVWINEAYQSDTEYVRKYIDNVDITGCDNYPIIELLKPEEFGIRESVDEVKFYTQRYVEVGRGKPVYMVLQAFSWPELDEAYWSDRPFSFPSFKESRYMAYISIAAGARGIYYWGQEHTKSEELTQSIYAVTSELSALQPFLGSPEEDHVRIRGIKTKPGEKTEFSSVARRYGRDWLIVVINETFEYQMSVVVENLEHLNGMKFHELYGEDEFTVSNEEMVLRMKPREVKVLSTSKRWETKRIKGRDYAGQ